MSRFTQLFLFGLLTVATPATVCAQSTGDLLVAPTRLVLPDNGGGEVLLSNKGGDTATYRTSLILKVMQPDGQFSEIATPTPAQQSLIDMVSFAPRRVVLAPGQTQTVRINARMPAELASGEYRVHMLFRAVPNASQTIQQAAQAGVSIALTPVYGVTIPIITRKGQLDAKVTIENVRLVPGKTQSLVSLDLTRSGTRSIYGSLRVFRPGQAQALATLRGIAVYTELGRRHVDLPLPAEAGGMSKGPLIVRFSEEEDTPGKLQAEATIAS